jgi:putative nucleotidyltransferase with HDIG domain
MKPLELVRTGFSGTPFEGKVLPVGGWVRNRVLGLPVDEDDLDCVVLGSALDAARLLWEKGVADTPPAIYPRFGTAMVRAGGTVLELASSRRESYSPESRKPDVEPAPLADDLLRRDFTVNALLYDPWSEKVLDPLGMGLEDLSRGILRTPRDPVVTFRDDPLRMIRAVRFRWRFQFSYAPDLEAAIQGEAGRIDILSGERIRDEIHKMFLFPRSAEAFEDMRRLGILGRFCPELLEGVGVEQGKWHKADVWGHTLEVLRNVGPGDTVLCWAALMHDIAKPRTKILDDEGQIRFFGHESVGARMSEEILRRLHLAGKEVDAVSLLVRNHMRLGSFPRITRPIARRLARDLGPQLERLFLLCEADARALKEGVARLDVSVIRECVAEVAKEDPKQSWSSPLTGEEIMGALAIGPGREVGRWKDWLGDQVVEGRLNAFDREGALKMLQSEAVKGP